MRTPLWVGGTLASLLRYALFLLLSLLVTVFVDYLVFCGGFLAGCVLTVAMAASFRSQ